MSTPTRPEWEIAHDCHVATRRAHRRRSIAERVRTRARRVRSARGSLVTVAALVAIAAPLALASGGGGTLLQRLDRGARAPALQRALGLWLLRNRARSPRWGASDLRFSLGPTGLADGLAL